LNNSAILSHPTLEMDPPQTKKQQHKSGKEKRQGHGNLHSAKGTRAIEANQEKHKKPK
jgi:hypothetical protein